MPRLQAAEGPLVTHAERGSESYLSGTKQCLLSLKKKKTCYFEIMIDSQEAEDRRPGDVHCVSHSSPSVSLRKSWSCATPWM